MAELSTIRGGVSYPKGVSSYLNENSSPTKGLKTSGEDQAAADTAEISPEAKKKLAEETTEKTQNAMGGTGDLSEEQQKDVDHLKKRDVEVRQHEQAHIMAGGSLIRGGASFTYKTGPDGKQYAIGGEVSIDSSPVEGDPRATIRKAQQIQKAAMAPGEPSGQDRAAAAEAAAMELAAMRELTQKSGTNQKAGINLGA
jgi:hypothetical protein